MVPIQCDKGSMIADMEIKVYLGILITGFFFNFDHRYSVVKITIVGQIQLFCSQNGNVRQISSPKGSFCILSSCTQLRIYNLRGGLSGANLAQR